VIVLVVDDSELTTRAIRRALCSRFQVMIANSVAQALSEIERREPDVVVCDFELGDATATDLLRIITERWPKIRRVLYSASRPELWGLLVDEKLIDVALAKPSTRDQLLAAIGT
jgi:DNA-binding NarL/FixJ family response regulator